MALTKATQNVLEGIVSTGSTGVSAGSFIVAQQYKITALGTTTQAQWNTIAGTTGQTYVVGSLFTAATTGASSGTGAAAVARTLANRFADVVNVKDFGAVGDGVADDTAAIQAAINKNATVFFPKGTYNVTSNITFTNLAFFDSNAIINSNATITFNMGIDAPSNLLFTGSQLVSGLKKVDVMWFAEDKLNTNTDALTSLQKAYDACVFGAAVYFPIGAFKISGSTPIIVSKGQQTIGVSKFVSSILYTGTISNIFRIQDFIGAGIEQMTLGWVTPSQLPTGGAIIDVQIGYTKFEDIVTNGGWYGISYQNTNVSFVNSIQIQDSINTGIRISNSSEIHVNNFIVTALLERIQVSNVTGTFLANENITGLTSGTVASALDVVSPTILRAMPNSGTDTNLFTVGETIQGGTSGATATVVLQTIPHFEGGIRLQDQCEAIILSNADVLGGRYPMILDATVNAIGKRPAYNKFSQIYFDSSNNGALVKNSVEIDFTACWFSNRPNDGLTIIDSQSIKLTGGGAINCGGNGVGINSGSKFISIVNFTASGNNTRNIGAHGIGIESNTSDFVITNCRLGGTLGFGTQQYGVILNAGTSNRYSITNNLVSGNSLGGVSDGGTGVNKFVANNF